MEWEEAFFSSFQFLFTVFFVVVVVVFVFLFMFFFFSWKEFENVMYFSTGAGQCHFL